MPDRSAALRLLEQRRARERADALDIDRELLAAQPFGEAVLSPAALARAQALVAMALRQIGVGATSRSIVEGTLRCTIERTPGTDTELRSAQGRLVLRDLSVVFAASDELAASAGGRP